MQRVRNVADHQDVHTALTSAPKLSFGPIFSWDAFQTAPSERCWQSSEARKYLEQACGNQAFFAVSARFRDPAPKIGRNHYRVVPFGVSGKSASALQAACRRQMGAGSMLHNARCYVIFVNIRLMYGGATCLVACPPHATTST